MSQKDLSVLLGGGESGSQNSGKTLDLVHI